MILSTAFRVAHNAFKDFNHLFGLDNESSLFHYFTTYTIGERFSGFEDSAGQRPPALQRLAPAFDEQDAILAVENERSYSENGSLRVAAANDVLPVCSEAQEEVGNGTPSSQLR